MRAGHALGCGCAAALATPTACACSLVGVRGVRWWKDGAREAQAKAIVLELIGLFGVERCGQLLLFVSARQLRTCARPVESYCAFPALVVVAGACLLPIGPSTAKKASRSEPCSKSAFLFRDFNPVLARSRSPLNVFPNGPARYRAWVSHLAAADQDFLFRKTATAFYRLE